MTTDLGVLLGKGDMVPDRVAPALHALAERGLTKPDDELVGAIRLAMMHRSYLYENRGVLSGITTRHLDALGFAGGVFLRRAAAINTYLRYKNAASGLLSIEVAHIDTVLPIWAADAEWISASALLGKGESAGELKKKVLAGLVSQLLGLLCLADETAVAEALLTGLFTKARDKGQIIDPKTTLQEILSGEAPRYEHNRTGPDHGATFHAVVTDAAGRSGEGEGGNKTAASQAAALDFIQKHCPDRVRTVPTPSGPPCIPHPITSSEAHTHEIARLQQIFGLPFTAQGLFSQALIHPSWAYEHAQAMQDTGQQNNQTLAYLGSVAIWYEYAVAITRSELASSGEDTIGQGFPTPQNSTYAEAFHRTGCAPGLLLGKGQAQHGEITMVMASDVFQALFAAALIARRFPASLKDSWPDCWRPIWELLAPGHTRPESANGRLAVLAGSTGLSVEHRYEADGPVHASRYRATTDIDSAVLGRIITLTGTFKRSKPEARDSAARPIVALLDILAEDVPSLSPDLAAAPIQFLVAHLATTFAAEPHRGHAWAKSKLLGLHLAQSGTRLFAWAKAVDRLVGNDLDSCPIPALASAYARALAGTANSAACLDDVAVTGEGPLTQAIRIALAPAKDSGQHDVTESAQQ